MHTLLNDRRKSQKSTFSYFAREPPYTLVGKVWPKKVNFSKVWNKSKTALSHISEHLHHQIGTQKDKLAQLAHDKLHSFKTTFTSLIFLFLFFNRFSEFVFIVWLNHNVQLEAFLYFSLHKSWKFHRTLLSKDLWNDLAEFSKMNFWLTSCNNCICRAILW